MPSFVKLGFEWMSKAAFANALAHVAAGMKDNVHFPMPWWGDPAKTPTPSSLKAGLVELVRLEERAAVGGKGPQATYWKRRAELENGLRVLAVYVELKAKGDLAKLESTGFAMRRPRTHTGGPGPLAAPEELKVRHGGLEGMAVVGVRPVKGCRRIEIKGLSAGVLHKFRIRAIGSKGPGAWSGTVALMVV